MNRLQRLENLERQEDAEGPAPKFVVVIQALDGTLRVDGEVVESVEAAKIQYGADEAVVVVVKDCRRRTEPPTGGA